MVRTKSQPSRRGHSMGIAHTRWATKGSKTDLNAHPHTDASGRIAIVHNGALYNADALRTWLEAKGCVFWGDTDSEVIAKLIGYIYYLEKDNQNGKWGLKEAVEKALSICEGTWVSPCWSRDSRWSRKRSRQSHNYTDLRVSILCSGTCGHVH